VLALVVRQSSIPLMTGIVMGAGAAVALSAVVATLLFEMSARDPRVIGGVAAVTAAIGLAASLIAAKSGLLVNPAAVLRDEYGSAASGMAGPAIRKFRQSSPKRHRWRLSRL
jgi:hypothetical protein